METTKVYLYICLFIVGNVVAQTNYDISINTQGNLQTHNGSQIGIYGNLNNDGTFAESGGEVGFYNQDISQTITGTNTPEFNDLIVSAPNDLAIEVASNVNFALNFSQGRIITPRENPDVSINLVDTDIYFDENNDKHVDGYTSYTGNNAYTFPVGDEFRLREISIEANAAINTARAAYFFENPEVTSTFSGFDRNETEDSLESISAVEFWDLDGNTTTRATLTWDMVSNISSLINNDLSELRVVGWSIEEEQWVDLGNTNFSGDNTQGLITSANFIPNEYKVITFGGPRVFIDIPNDEIEVLNAISADGNDDNPYFRIKGINAFPNNNLKIFNRWGVVVFEVDGYTEPMPELGDELDANKVFMGVSNGRATLNTDTNLPTGTYFYILNYELNGMGEKSKAGYLYLQN